MSIIMNINIFMAVVHVQRDSACSSLSNYVIWIIHTGFACKNLIWFDWLIFLNLMQLEFFVLFKNCVYMSNFFNRRTRNRTKSFRTLFHSDVCRYTRPLGWNRVRRTWIERRSGRRLRHATRLGPNLRSFRKIAGSCEYCGVSVIPRPFLRNWFILEWNKMK